MSSQPGRGYTELTKRKMYAHLFNWTLPEPGLFHLLLWSRRIQTIRYILQRSQGKNNILIFHSIVIWSPFRKDVTWILVPSKMCMCTLTCTCEYGQAWQWVATPALWEKVLLTFLLLGMVDNPHPFCWCLKAHEGTHNKDYFFQLCKRSLILWPLGHTVSWTMKIILSHL